jgi:hypothetical protein
LVVIEKRKYILTEPVGDFTISLLIHLQTGLPRVADVISHRTDNQKNPGFSLRNQNFSLRCFDELRFPGKKGFPIKIG